MGFFTVLAAFCVAVSFMLPTCASDQVNVQKSLKQYGNAAVQQAKFTLPLLPRKLKLQQEIGKSFNDKNTSPHMKLMEASSDNKVESEKLENLVHHATGKGTWREWVEAPNKSDYFTMDYAWLRRRRPIHNKHIPINSVP